VMSYGMNILYDNYAHHLTIALCLVVMP
jgi:hypothetical protein